MSGGQIHEKAFRHVIAHRTMLLAYIGAFIRDPELAEDTLSDVSIEITRSWGRYDPSRPFGPWARGIARRTALANLRKHGGRHVLLDFEVLDAVGAEIDSLGDEAHLETHKRALRDCMGKLSTANEALVRMRYSENKTVKEIADLVDRSAEALYMAFSRIHAALSNCVKRRLESA